LRGPSSNKVVATVLRVCYRQLLDLADFQFDLPSSDMNVACSENPYQGMG
jgi:hypothetical protein